MGTGKSGVNDGTLAQALYCLKASVFKHGNSRPFTFYDENVLVQ